MTRNHTRRASSARLALLAAILLASPSAPAADGMPQVAHDEHAGHDHAAPATPEPPAAAPDAHDGHDHAAHGEEAEAGLRLTPEQRQRFGIVVREAGPGSLRSDARLPGEVVFNQDRLVHLTPRVAGVAREVYKSVGDRVKAGEVMAVLDSRELADAKAEFLAATARVALAAKVYDREKALRERKVSSEQELLEAGQADAEARIVRRAAEQKLHALGLTEEAVAALGDGQHDAAITRYELRAPIDGVVTERHIAPGESLGADADVFTVVDPATVWVNLTVHLRHLAVVRAGQEVTLRADHDGSEARGTIARVTPFVDPAVRSATARVVLDNADGRWVPGTFATGHVGTAQDDVAVAVPRQAVQSLEGRDVVFIEHEGAFKPVPVTLGRADRTSVEITAGLAPGTRYAAEGAFHLKATVVTSTLDSHAGHGH